MVYDVLLSEHFLVTQERCVKVGSADDPRIVCGVCGRVVLCVLLLFSKNRGESGVFHFLYVLQRA